MLRRIRITLAVICIVLITMLFLDFTGTLHVWLDWLAKIQFLPALLALNVGVIIALVLLTLVFGRIYCSVVCPLGVFQDFISWIASKMKKHRFSYSPDLAWLRYSILILFILAFATGISSFVALMEPYSAYGRIASNLFSPVYQWGNNILAYFAERMESYAFYSTEVWLKSGLTFGIAVATLTVIGVLAWLNGRTYCNTVCPVGTILGFVSRFSLLKPAIDTEKCNGCRSCARNCKASCINEKEHKIDYSRCVVCMNCIKTCKQNAINYRFIYKKEDISANKGEENGLSRRRFVTIAAGIGIGSLTKAQAPQLHADGGLTEIKDRKLPVRNVAVLPPGSQNARHFTKHCTGCQLCVSICPNQVLRPSQDLLSAMQPYMSFECGYCRPECTKCAEVCPSGAITAITVAKKSAIKVGRSVFVKELCINNTDKKPCDNCARHCPTAAITMIPNPDAPQEAPRAAGMRNYGPPPKPLQLPVIDDEKCIGCGACENLCPARPLSAIYVEGSLMHRIV